MKKTKPQYRGLIGAGFVLVAALAGGVLLIHRYSQNQGSDGSNPLAPLARAFGLTPKEYAKPPITNPIPDYRTLQPAAALASSDAPAGDGTGLDLRKLFKTTEQIRRDAASGVGAIIGVPLVIDGDTLQIEGKRIRLYAIDAPEIRQTCLHRTGEWDCGNRAGLWLQQFIAGNEVFCFPEGNDRHGNVVASCQMGDSDLGGAIVTNGWAVAYRAVSKTYVIAESNAKRKRLGLWDSEFAMPWDFRGE
ncbi:thermonuclease family protein (plasmid) [Xanthomonas citri pv. citri]|uniref:thermonuclease family protein n=1 Tax=Xanthomonas citri TaxID=346 RepID=UPI0019323DDA|nr:thermonuclease family protein [Xanthomonas citri]QRD62713.1 thermonuclease family protein [Xanthomonas citri pv. citri]QRD67040.1 thermonuclease family protein [Xanthomonas citri pv. citri]QRD71707.1 thermonuclease family protein [Xanthomonas citri pv. citri]